MKRAVKACFVLVAAASFACGGEGGVEVTPDVQEGDNSAEISPLPDVAMEIPAADPGGDPFADAGFDLPGETVDLLPTDLAWTPGPGEPGYPCVTPGDCDEGFCIHTSEGLQCTQTCEEECPFGWQCTLHEPSLPDRKSVV